MTKDRLESIYVRWIYFKIDLKWEGSEKDARKWWAGRKRQELGSRIRGRTVLKSCQSSLSWEAHSPLPSSLTAFSPTTATCQPRSFPCWTAKTDLTVFFLAFLFIYHLCLYEAFPVVSFPLFEFWTMKHGSPRTHVIVVQLHRRIALSKAVIIIIIIITILFSVIYFLIKQINKLRVNWVIKLTTIFYWVNQDFFFLFFSIQTCLELIFQAWVLGSSITRVAYLVSKSCTSFSSLLLFHGML